MSAWATLREALERRMLAWARDAPILWRTRLPIVLAVVFVADVILVAVASVWPVDSRAPSIDAIQSIAVNALTLLMASFGLWLGYELRRGLGTWSWRRRIRVGLCYFLAILAVLTAPLACFVPWLVRLADTVSDEQLAADQAFHSAFGHWACDPRITDDAVASNQTRILHAVDRYQRRDAVGAQPHWPSSQASHWLCPEGLPLVYVLFVDSDHRSIGSPIALRAPIESLAAAKDFRRGRGPFVGFLSTYWAAVLAFSLLLPSLLLWLDAGRQRERPWHLVRSDRLPNVGTLFGWRRLDRALVARRPLLWSSRLHAILPLTLLGSFGLVSAAVVLLRSFEPGASFWSTLLDAWDKEAAWTSSLPPVLSVGIVGLWWLGQRGVRLASRSAASALAQFALIAISVFSVLPIVAAVVLLFEPHAWDTVAGRMSDGELAETWIVYSLVPILWCVGFFVLKRQAGWLGIGLGLGSVGLSFFFLSMINVDSIGEGYWIVFTSWLLASCFLLVRSPDRRLVPVASAFLLASAPVLGYSLLDTFKPGGILWMFDPRSVWWYIAATLLCFVVAVLIVSRPLRVHHAAPKR